MATDDPTYPAETGIQPANQALVFLSMNSYIFEIEGTWGFLILPFTLVSMSGCKRTCSLGNCASSSTNTACWTRRETTEKRRRSQGIWHFFSRYAIIFFH